MNPLKICYVSSEVVPFAKTGGLADVAGSLPIALKALNQDIRLMMSKYKSINERKFVLREVIRLKEVPVKLGEAEYMADGKTAFLPNSKVHVYFLRIPEFFDRKELYVNAKTGLDFKDNAERFAAFSLSVLETLKLLYWQPDILHCNDWQTALIPFFLKTKYKDDPFFQKTKTVLTIHNLAFQGAFDIKKRKILGIPEEYTVPGGQMEFYGGLNFMKAGILNADAVTAVSEKYAEEISTDKKYGFGFEEIFKAHDIKVNGILNGADYTLWDPATDKLLPKKYNLRHLDRKEVNKKTLCTQCELPYHPETAVIGFISRLTDQKGLDILMQATETLLKENLQLVILGTGEQRYHDALKKLAKANPDKVSVHLRFDNKLAHLIEAGSDMFLMPSQFEPCGLNQIYSLKYGTVPVVRHTGGLADTIKDFDEKKKDGNGFSFEEYSAPALVKAVQRALAVFSQKETWTELQKACMRHDFSWEISAKKYMELYRETYNR